MPDCLRKAGKSITKNYDLPEFTEIMTYRKIQLYITDGQQQKVRAETGKNLLKNIELKVKNGRLEIKNKNKCDWVHGYKKTKVYVTSPNLHYIQNGSQFDIVSTNTLHYNNLKLISEDWQDSGKYYTSGNFNLKLDCKNLVLVTNFLSSFYLSGKVKNFKIGIYSGDGRIEAENLVVQNVDIFHRGTNDVILNPQQSITGELVSTGNLILVHHPPIVNVDVQYKGEMIFK